MCARSDPHAHARWSSFQHHRSVLTSLPTHQLVPPRCIFQNATAPTHPPRYCSSFRPASVATERLPVQRRAIDNDGRLMAVGTMLWANAGARPRAARGDIHVRVQRPVPRREPEPHSEWVHEVRGQAARAPVGHTDHLRVHHQLAADGATLTHPLQSCALHLPFDMGFLGLAGGGGG
jgi:hypothetical protein